MTGKRSGSRSKKTGVQNQKTSGHGTSRVYSSSVQNRYVERKRVCEKLNLGNCREDKLIRIYEDALLGVGRYTRYARKQLPASKKRMEKRSRIRGRSRK